MKKVASKMSGSTLSFKDSGEMKVFCFDDLSEEKKQLVIGKQLAKVELNYEKKLQQVKSVVFEEAAIFLKEQAKNITDALTKQHQNIAQQFI